MGSHLCVHVSQRVGRQLETVPLPENEQAQMDGKKEKQKVCPIAAYEQSSTDFAFDLTLRLLFI